MGKNAQKPRRDWWAFNHIIAAPRNHNVANRRVKQASMPSFQTEAEGQFIAPTVQRKDNFARLKNWNHIVATRKFMPISKLQWFTELAHEKRAQLMSKSMMARFCQTSPPMPTSNWYIGARRRYLIFTLPHTILRAPHFWRMEISTYVSANILSKYCI